MKKITLLCSLWFSIGCAFAQNNTAQVAEANQAVSSEDNQIVEVTHKFYTALETFSRNKEIILEPITNFLDKDYLSTRYIINVNGKQTRSETKLADYRNQLVAFKSIQGLVASYRVEKINFVRSYDAFATINYIVLVTASINDEVVLKFRSLVTNYLRKDENGEWKIIESNGLNVYKEQEIGICPIAISKKANNVNMYNTTVLSPAGNSFKTDSLTFAFKVANTKTIITCGQNGYLLENNEVICVKDEGKVVSVKLGKGTTKTEAINTILSQHLYANKCMGFKTLTK